MGPKQEGSRGGRSLQAWESFVGLLRGRVRADFDNVLVVDGEEGVGKSTFALTLARSLTDGRFDPSQVVYNFEDWERVVDLSKRGNVYLLDEGGNLGFSRDHSTGENKRLVKILMVARQVNPTLILCIPNFRWLDVYLREHRAHFRVHIERRGVAIVQERVTDWHAGNVWFEDHYKFYFDPFPGDDPFWKAYLGRKRAALLQSAEPVERPTDRPRKSTSSP